ncbi:uncharacterized protein LOC135950615 [Calliphora vicina]|uniref:uncharacterized protein LOC135950615 n=1 Tax=Calliphora vicina TaxID=7373 RepID=UPI00325B74F2
MEKEKAKVRKTIFLDEDDIPSTSKGLRGQDGFKRRHVISPTKYSRHQRQNQSPKRPAKPRKSTYCYRMTTQQRKDPVIVIEDSPPKNLPKNVYEEEDMELPPPPDFVTPENIAEEEDEVPPPPPPFVAEDHPITQDNWDDEDTEPPPSPAELDGDFIDLGNFEDLLSECDLPIVEEIYRRFFGVNDDTICLRPVTPPSLLHPRSLLSLDWENENYNPPKPPRRQGIGSWELKDSQYRHLGLICYERAFRVRLMIPVTEPTGEIGYVDLDKETQTSPIPKPPVRDWFIPLSPTPFPPTRSPIVPKTPGRDWFIPLLPTPYPPSQSPSSQKTQVRDWFTPLPQTSLSSSSSSPTRSLASAVSPTIITISSIELSSPSSVTSSPPSLSLGAKHHPMDTTPSPRLNQTSVATTTPPIPKSSKELHIVTF